jgi:hypothetical protein
LAPGDTNAAPDVYELATGSAPKLVTSGKGTDTYVPVAVSNDGQRVAYDDKPAEVPEIVNEWVHAQTAQLSPQGSANSYDVAATAGPGLEDVFFVAHDPLVPYDQNAGTATVYDARVDGGYPAPSEQANNNDTSNPVRPPTAAYDRNLTPPSRTLGLLPPDTSHLAKTSTRISLTRAQKLAKALRSCKKDKPKSKRRRCEQSARNRYGTNGGTNARKATHATGSR